MALLELKLTVVSPMFLNGADTKQPEFRAASVRGQLRYWLRAYLGAQTSDLKAIWEKESAVFGSTGQGSAVSVRLFGIATVSTGSYAMLPHKKNEREQSFQKAISPDTKFTVQLVTRPGVEIPPYAITAFRLWSLLGGLGKRSRRMFGAFSVSGDFDNSPASITEYQSLLETLLQELKPHASSIPEFPTLHPSHSWIIVGRTAYDTYEEAVKYLFTDLLRIPVFRGINNQKEKTFGSASPRRSAPLIAQIRRIGDSYYPILTAIRSRPDSTIDWSHLKKFMETAAESKHFNAEKIVWGGW